MFLFKSIALAAATASSLVYSAVIVADAAADIERRANDVTVTLSSVGETTIKAVIKNNRDTEYSILTAGSFLDGAPVQKATVFKDGTALEFTGILLRAKTSGLGADAFKTLAPGSTLENTFDVAAVTDLSAGGVFEVVSEGAFPVAKPGTTELSPTRLAFRSNQLAITVDGAKAAKVEAAIKILDERTVLRSCSGSWSTTLRTALTNARTLSLNAASAAQSGSAAKFQEYFKTTSSSARNTVAARFRGVATQAGSTNSGSTSYYCNDPYGYCEPNVLAYTLPSQNLIANCPIYYSALPALTRSCHAQDQATTSLHEFTHAPATYSPGTQDNAYGYAASTALTSSQAINNADSYALYANAIYAGC
ncbi:MAG: hypothetical protein LQ342_007867 [Letrouitia transgressa]|nr:MAG: hypothetical protein LQ342_007867 [Letrouitia transgressa]